MHAGLDFNSNLVTSTPERPESSSRRQPALLLNNETGPSAQHASPPRQLVIGQVDCAYFSLFTRSSPTSGSGFVEEMPEDEDKCLLMLLLFGSCLHSCTAEIATDSLHLIGIEWKHFPQSEILPCKLVKTGQQEFAVKASKIGGSFDDYFPA